MTITPVSASISRRLTNTGVNQLRRLTGNHIITITIGPKEYKNKKATISNEQFKKFQTYSSKFNRFCDGKARKIGLEKNIIREEYTMDDIYNTYNDGVKHTQLFIFEFKDNENIYNACYLPNFLLSELLKFKLSFGKHRSYIKRRKTRKTRKGSSKGSRKGSRKKLNKRRGSYRI